ncbi:hypothetical protein LXA47_25900, partial [Massilia sp. P8910]|uniref:hypothetical protein n=1 Tax=Massilia antarctica TaxID=2765360 RepID=UPI001E44145B
MTKKLGAQFELISRSLIDACTDPTFGEDRLEPLYIIFLEFLKENENQREHLIEFIFDAMRKYRTARATKENLLPGTAIAYAMHELRWPEILKFAELENREFYLTRMSTVMTSIMDAYSDEWEDKFFYVRFRQG